MNAPGPLLARGAIADIFAWGDTAIVKLYHDSPETAEREAARARAVVAAGIVAPRVLDVVAVDGQPGIVFERADGPTMLEALRTGSPAPVAREFAALHASLHERNVPALPTQRSRLAPKIERGLGLAEAARTAVLERLERLPDGDTLCHGDFHPKNVVLSPGGPIVLDWVNATRGDPLSDVALTLILIEHGGPTLRPSITPAARGAFALAYLTAYSARRPIDPVRLHDWRVVAAAARLSERMTGEQRAALVSVVSTWRQA